MHWAKINTLSETAVIFQGDFIALTKVEGAHV
jgi:hypothetical protein